jgi:integral membrane protein (TIGR00529 family)
MEFILHIPFIIRILFTLTLILVLYRLFKNLIISLLAGILLLSLWTGHSITQILNISWMQFSAPDNLLLLVIILQVIWLSTQMKQTGVMQDLVSTVSRAVSKKCSLAVLPALIGLLPMPGGALFSAPMVKDVDSANEVRNLDKTKINYWFRHVWEYWWPLYPGVLLAISITKLEIWQFMLLQLPLSLFSVLGGYLFLLRPLKIRTQTHNQPHSQAAARFGMLIAPIQIVIGVYFLIQTIFPGVRTISRYLPMIIAIGAAQIFLQLIRPLSLKKILKIMSSLSSYKLAFIVALILVYGAFIKARGADGVLLTEHIRAELNTLSIPMFVVIIFIPFFSGLTTGIAVGFVGTSFPIVINLLGTNPTLPTLLSFTFIAYAFGYMGMMLSPLHVCHLVTNEYFKTNLIKSIIELLKPVTVVVAGALGLFVLIQLVL